MTPEGKVKAKIAETLKKYGVHYFMPEHMGLGKTGVVDYVCCISGRFVAIEAKADASKHPTWKQWEFMVDTVNAGGCALVINRQNTGDLAYWIELLKRGLLIAPAFTPHGSNLRFVENRTYDNAAARIQYKLPPMPDKPTKKAGLKPSITVTEWL